MARFLVTGGAGFIGSNLVRALLHRGDRVRVLDDLSTGHRDNLRGLGSGCDVLVGSVDDPSALRKALEGVDHVVHLAAVISVPYSIEHPEQTRRINDLGTRAVLDEARRAGAKRVVISSSCAVYGENQEMPLHEDASPDPRSPYAETKLAGEQHVRECYAVHGQETVALRYFNVFGPRQDPESPYAAVVPLFIRAFLRGEGVALYGDGLQTRDFCFVEDVVRANLLACDAPGIAGRVFNVGTGVPTSLQDLLGELQVLFGESIDVRPDPPRAGDLRHSQADVGRACGTLGFRAETSLRAGLERTIQWYRALETELASPIR